MPDPITSADDRPYAKHGEKEREAARKYFELQTTITAGERWIDELQFQIMRLENHVVATTDEEKEFHARLHEGYSTAARYSTVLLKYQKGRLAKLQGAPEPEESPYKSIMEDGRVAPVFEEDER